MATKNRKVVTELEDSLIALDMATSSEKKRPGEFIELSYRLSREAVEKARIPLLELGMYEKVVNAIDTAESLLKHRQFDEASAELYNTYRELMEKSGTDERNARRYGKDGPGAQGVAMVVTADGVEEWGVLGPDAYEGAFLQSVSTAERDLVFAVDGRISGLRSAVLAAEVDVILKHPGASNELSMAFQDVHAAIIKARLLLEKLGVYTMLLGALEHARSLTEDGEYAEAEQLLEMAAKALGDRCGITALLAQHFPRSKRG